MDEEEGETMNEAGDLLILATLIYLALRELQRHAGTWRKGRRP